MNANSCESSPHWIRAFIFLAQNSKCVNQVSLGNAVCINVDRVLLCNNSLMKFKLGKGLRTWRWIIGADFFILTWITSMGKIFHVRNLTRFRSLLSVSLSLSKSPRCGGFQNLFQVPKSIMALQGKHHSMFSYHPPRSKLKIRSSLRLKTFDWGETKIFIGSVG